MNPAPPKFYYAYILKGQGKDFIYREEFETVWRRFETA